MSAEHPRSIRRRLLLSLYKYYTENPHQMLSPRELMDDTGVSRKAISPAIFYLHERGYVEVMMGFNPPLFDAARISPDGVDLAEDEEALDRRFPRDGSPDSTVAPEAVALVLELAVEADHAPLEGAQKQWLLADLRHLLDEVRKPVHRWRRGDLADAFKWVEEYFNGDAAAHLPTINKVKEVVDALLGDGPEQQQ